MPTSASSRLVSGEPRKLGDGQLADMVYRHALCAGSPISADQWFPIAQDVAVARQQAADAIAICGQCPVRAQCLELSFRHSSGFGAHGIWGGLVEGERRLLRRAWRCGATVRELL